LIQAIADQANKLNKKKNQTMEEALDELAKNTPDLNKKKDEPKPKDDNRPVQECVIVGYTVEKDQQLRRDRVTGLVIATLVDGKIKFAGVVRRGFDSRNSDELLRRLSPLVQPEPFIRGLNTKAIWVKPEVFCEIRQSGFDRDGRLKDPSFKDVMAAQ
jgi:ATP-dependent DNA ligase